MVLLWGFILGASAEKLSGLYAYWVENFLKVVVWVFIILISVFASVAFRSLVTFSSMQSLFNE